MKRKLLAFIAFLLTSTNVHASRKHKPDVFVRLGQDSQICAPKGKKTAEVDIFITILHAPPSPVEVVADDSIHIDNLLGETVQVHFARVGIGPHKADVYVRAIRPEPYTILWSVYDCTPPGTVQ